MEVSPLELLDGPLPVPIVAGGEGLPGPCSKPAYTARGGGVEEDGALAEDDGSDSDGPGCIPIGRGRSGGGVRLRPGSGMRGEGGGVVPRGAGASGALVIVLEAPGEKFAWGASSYDIQWRRHPVPGRPLHSGQ